MKILIIPTLNENKNITPLFKKIKKVDKKIDILLWMTIQKMGQERNLKFKKR